MNLENNCLREEIKTIIYLCKQMETMNSSWFTRSAGEDAVALWEKQNQVRIPKSYRDWLLFADSAEIFNFAARFFGTREMVAQAPYIPKDMVLIGYLIGDGELVCFSKTTGKFARVFEDKTVELNNFSDILAPLIAIGKAKLGMNGEVDRMGAKIFVMLAEMKKASRPLSADEKSALAFLQSKIKQNEKGEFVLRDLTLSELTQSFNKLSIENRRALLKKLNEQEHAQFIEKLRHQAIQDFWNHERNLIREGKGTRDWIPEQMDSILNISRDGNERADAGHP